MDITKIEQKTNLIREYVEDDDFDKAHRVLLFDFSTESNELMLKALGDVLVSIDQFTAKRFVGYLSNKYFDTVYARTRRTTPRRRDNYDPDEADDDIGVEEFGGVDETPATTHTHTMTDPGHDNGVINHNNVTVDEWYVNPANLYTRYATTTDPVTFTQICNRRLYVTVVEPYEGMPYGEDL